MHIGLLIALEIFRSILIWDFFQHESDHDRYVYSGRQCYEEGICQTSDYENVDDED